MKKIIEIILGIIILSGVGFILYKVAPYQIQDDLTATMLDVPTSSFSIQTLNDNNEVLEGVNTNEEVSSENQEKNMKAIFNTNKGNFEIELFKELAPKTVDNFVTLVESNFYDGVKFHRVIKNFMIQAGDPNTKSDDMMDLWGTGGPGYQFEDEIHAENNNVIGTISMANAGPDTNGSQFFINTTNNDFLDTKHTVFGKVVSGIDVVSEIENTEAPAPRNIPIESIIINSITIN